jgi:type IV secretory pathway VirJ component
MNKGWIRIAGFLLFAIYANVCSAEIENKSFLFVKPGLNSKDLIESKPFFQTAFDSNLPLKLFPSSGKENLPLAIFISGDGGWGSFDQKVCENLSAKGMPVIGLDSRKYFWSEKQPKETADELSKAVVHYMKLWNKTSFIITGYSFGACVAPVIANSFTGTIKETIIGIVCVSPDISTDLEVHISDMLSMGPIEKYDVLDELKKLTSLKPVCVFGADEDLELKKHFSVPGIRVETLPGGHRFANDQVAVAGIILKNF